MEQILVLILFVVGSIVSTIIQNKKKREEEARQHREQEAPVGPPPPLPKKPFQKWPESGAEWQDELRRLFDQEKPPPVIAPAPRPAPVVLVQRPAAPVPAELKLPPAGERPKVIVNLFKGSDDAFSRARGMHERVRAQMRSVDQAMHHKGGARPPRPTVPAVRIRRWTRDRRAVREAFIASLIFSPPVAFTPPDARPPV
jgi:hypothetical protein